MGTIININRRAYPSPLGGMVVVAVLAHRIEGYCVYCGIMRDPPTMTEADEATWVASNGNKVPYGEAKSHFPGLKAERYAFP